MLVSHHVEIFYKAYSDFIKQIKEMDINMLEFGGTPNTTLLKGNKLENFIKTIIKQIETYV